MRPTGFVFVSRGVLLSPGYGQVGNGVNDTYR